MNRNFLDRVIGWVSPTAERRRLAERARIDAMLGKREYAGATAGRRAGDWIRGGKDGTAEARAAAKSLRESARSLVRDNAYASLALEEWEANVAPIAARAMIDELNPDRARAANEAIDRVWYEWTCRADYNGLTSFEGLQFLVVRALIQDGGCLIRRHSVPSSMKMPVPFQLQLLELDYLDDTKDGQRSADGSSVIGGIEFGPDGRRRGYWLFREHPGAAQTIAQNSRASVFVPADEMLHVFDPLRPGQQLGASRYASVILRTRDIDGYEEAELVRKQTEACLVGAVEDANPDANETQTVGASVMDASGNLIETFSPGMMAYLPPGRSIKFHQPSATGGYSDYVCSQLHGVAAGIGVPYEQMTGDLSRVTFISGRLGMLSFRRRVNKMRTKVFIPQFLEPVWAWFIDAALASGAIQTLPDQRVWAKWTPPRWESIQPREDAEADLTDIRSGARTLAQVITERGGDPADQLREIAETNAMLDEQEIVLDSDPRHRTKTGNPTEVPGPEETAEEPQPARDLRVVNGDRE